MTRDQPSVGNNLLADCTKETKHPCVAYVCCETLNVCVLFISRTKQNREIKGREYQLQAQK